MKKHLKIQRILLLCGQKVTLIESQTGKEKTFRAVIQPLRYRNNAHTGGNCLPPGFADTENYLYLGPADPPVFEYRGKGFLQASGQRFLIRRGPPVYLENQIAYVWAVLQKCHGEESYGLF